MGRQHDGVDLTGEEEGADVLGTQLAAGLSQT